MAESSTTPVFITGLFASVAWFLSLFSGVYCSFVTNTLATGNSDDSNITLGYGIWMYRGYLLVADPDEAVVYETCKAYPNNMTIDSKWRSAMAFSTLTLVIGAGVTLWALFAACGNPTKSASRIAGFTLLICCLFEGLSLLFLTSTVCTNNELTAALKAGLQMVMPLLELEDTCAMSTGAKCTIAAVVLWFVAALPVLKVDIPPRRAVGTEQAATEEKEIDPDNKLFDKEEAAGEDMGDEHTLETTEAA